jgi:hypothetical protein
MEALTLLFTRTKLFDGEGAEALFRCSSVPTYGQLKR